MKKVVLSTLTLCFLLISFSCSKKLRNDEFSIKGTFENPKVDSYVYLKEISPNEIITIDSVKITSLGEYSFCIKMPYETLYMIYLNEKEFVTLCPKPKETILLHADQNAFSETYTASGSPESEKLWNLNKKSLKGVSDLDLLAKTWDNSKLEPKKVEIRTKLDTLYQNCFAEQRQYMLNFIDQNEGSLTTLIAINKQFNKQDIFTPEDDLDIFLKVAKNLQQTLPENPHTIRFTKSVEKLKALELIQQANQIKEYE